MSEFLDCCPNCGYKADGVKKTQIKHADKINLPADSQTDLFLKETQFLKNILNRLKEKEGKEELEKIGKTTIADGECDSHITVDASGGSIRVETVDKGGAPVQTHEFYFEHGKNRHTRECSGIDGKGHASSEKSFFPGLFFKISGSPALIKYKYKNNAPTWQEINLYHSRYDKIKVFYKNIPTILEVGESVKRIFDKAGNELQVGVGKGKYILKMIYKSGSTKTEHIGYNFVTGGFLYEMEKEAKK